MQRNKAILIGVHIRNQQHFSESMMELERLAEACDIEVTGQVTQKLNKENSTSYLGKGKLDEVRALLDQSGAEMVISDDELSPSQIRGLEEVLNCRIIDRTVLILDIFAKRAKTKEAKLQVEISKSQYLLPRLAGSNESLGRQGGGSGLKNRGSGETKLELDRRRLEDRIISLTHELENLVGQRQNQRKKRMKSDAPVIALVGYTNSGKSTIMNAMLDRYQKPTDKQVFEKDMLFATLETSVRSIKLHDNKSFLLTDTVGFISKLPHQLVKAFRSTLEEVTEADLLVHVVDYSNPDHQQQMKVTEETLKVLGADKIPVIYAYNKIDLVEGEAFRIKDDSVYISAKSSAGIDMLTDVISKKVFTHYVKCEMLVPYDKGNIISHITGNAHIISSEYTNDGIMMNIECSEADYNRYKGYVLSMI